MNFPPRLSSRLWLIALLGAGGFLLWTDAARIRRVEYISGLTEPAVTAEAASPTGYAAGLRRLIVPEHNNESYQWIAQTQQMFARGEWRVRHVDYDNAPEGRAVRTPSPYRWWLGLVAWCDHALTGRSLGLAVEHAAQWVDPVCHLLLLISVVVFAARQFGGFPATLLALGLAAVFPFASAFLPSQPGDSALTQAAALWSVLLLLAGIGAGRRTRRWFFAAGVAGGLGLWVNVACELPILGGVAVGGFLASWLARRTGTADAAEAAPWRSWALGGALTCLGAYLIEYYPAHMEGLRLETIHPLFGLAWLGAGELLEAAAAWGQNKKSPWNIRHVVRVLLAVLAVATVPVVSVWTGNSRFWPDSAFASRLASLPDSPAAQTPWRWFLHDGFTTMMVATLLPLLLLGPALWLLARRESAPAQRTSIALALGPVLVALVFACFQLGWWGLLDGMLLTLLTATTAATGAKAEFPPGRWLATGGLLLALVPSAVLLSAPIRNETREVTESDVVALIERDLSHWLGSQAGPDGRVVLAPPSLTTSLYFHGGLAGLGTPYWENKDGFAAAVRIASATSPEEAQVIALRHNLTYIILPSWDPFMDEYARLGSGHADRSLVALLHGWLPPRWLRPVPYHLPKITGFEGMSVAIFQVTDLQDNPTALSRLAEYFLEMGQIDQAVAVSQALERLFPTDLGALVARTMVEQARGSGGPIKELPDYISRGEDDSLPWDRRVSLAIALTEGKSYELARAQTKRCLAELDEAHLRSLTTVSLYRLQVMGKAFRLEITDPRLRNLARGLLPAELRGKL